MNSNRHFYSSQAHPLSSEGIKVSSFFGQLKNRSLYIVRKKNFEKTPGVSPRRHFFPERRAPELPSRHLARSEGWQTNEVIDRVLRVFVCPPSGSPPFLFSRLRIRRVNISKSCLTKSRRFRCSKISIEASERWHVRVSHTFCQK